MGYEELFLCLEELSSFPLSCSRKFECLRPIHVNDSCVTAHHILCLESPSERSRDTAQDFGVVNNLSNSRMVIYIIYHRAESFATLVQPHAAEQQPKIQHGMIVRTPWPRYSCITRCRLESLILRFKTSSSSLSSSSPSRPPLSAFNPAGQFLLAALCRPRGAQHLARASPSPWLALLVFIPDLGRSPDRPGGVLPSGSWLPTLDTVLMLVPPARLPVPALPLLQPGRAQRLRIVLRFPPQARGRRAAQDARFSEPAPGAVAE